MMDLTVGDASDGETAGLLGSVARLDEVWPMDEGADCESQKDRVGGELGEDNARSTSFSEVGTGRSKPGLAARRVGLRELGAVPAST